MNRVRLLCFLAAIALLNVGCIGESGASAAVEVPWPSAGSAGRYHGGGHEFSIRVESPVEIKDVSGARVNLLGLRWQDEFGDLERRRTEYVDAQGHMVLSFSDCSPGYLPPGACDASTRSSGTYFQHGMYALFGTSWMWGERLLEGPRSVTYAVGGEQFFVDYHITSFPGAACLRGEAEEHRSFSDQSLAEFVGIPSEFIQCDGEAFPRLVRLGGVAFERSELAGPAASPSVATLSVSTDPRNLPPDARIRPANPLPEGSGYSPTGFSLADAWRYLSTENTEARTFLETEQAGLRSAVFWPASGGALAPIDVDALKVTRATATIALEGREDRVKVFNLSQECELAQCRIRSGPSSSMRAQTSSRDPSAGAVPLYLVIDAGNRTLGSPVASFGVESILRTLDVPDLSSGGRLFVTMRVLPPGVTFGVPYRATIDATSMRVLVFDVPDEQAAEITGITARVDERRRAFGERACARESGMARLPQRAEGLYLHKALRWRGLRNESRRASRDITFRRNCVGGGGRTGRWCVKRTHRCSRRKDESAYGRIRVICSSGEPGD